MRISLKQYVARATQHTMVSILGLASFAFVAGGMLWAYMALKDVSPPLVTHFISLQGITQIGTLNDLLNVGLFGICAVVINFVLAWELDLRTPLWGKVLMVGTAFLGLLLFIGFAAIININ